MYNQASLAPQYVSRVEKLWLICNMIELFHMIFSIYGFVALNVKSYGTFCILKSPITS